MMDLTFANRKAFGNTRIRIPVVGGGQHGFSLIESVISLCVVSFGLISLAYLQASGMRHGQEAGARTQASLIAGGLLERIRNSQIPADSMDAATYTDPPPDTPACNPTAAGPASDRDCFYQKIAERIPTGAGSISVSSGGYLITVAWLDRDAARYDSDGNGLSESECEAHDRLWYDDADLVWRPATGKPSQPACLFVLRWTLVQ